jgi:hypothetical protein
LRIGVLRLCFVKSRTEAKGGNRIFCMARTRCWKRKRSLFPIYLQSFPQAGPRGFAYAHGMGVAHAAPLARGDISHHRGGACREVAADWSARNRSYRRSGLIPAATLGPPTSSPAGGLALQEGDGMVRTAGVVPEGTLQTRVSAPPTLLLRHRGTRLWRRRLAKNLQRDSEFQVQFSFMQTASLWARRVGGWAGRFL